MAGRKLRIACHLEELMKQKAKELRLEDARFGFSRLRLSEESGVSQATIRGLLKGDIVFLHTETIAKLMIFFNCKFDELFTIELEDEDK